VFTVEPGLYIRKDAVLADEVFGDLDDEERDALTAALDRYDGIGVRISQLPFKL